MVLPKPQIFFQDKRPRIFRFLLALFFIILTVLLFEGAYFYFKPKNEVQPPLTDKAEIEAAVEEQGGSRTLDEEMTGFWGEVKEKGDGFLLIEGGGEVIKVKVTSQTQFRKFPLVLRQDNPLQTILKGEIIKFDDLEEGDIVDVVGKDKGVFFEALMALVYK